MIVLFIRYFRLVVAADSQSAVATVRSMVLPALALLWSTPTRSGERDRRIAIGGWLRPSTTGRLLPYRSTVVGSTGLLGATGPVAVETLSVSISRHPEGVARRAASCHHTRFRFSDPIAIRPPPGCRLCHPKRRTSSESPSNPVALRPKPDSYGMGTADISTAIRVDTRFVR